MGAVRAGSAAELGLAPAAAMEIRARRQIAAERAPLGLGVSLGPQREEGTQKQG